MRTAFFHALERLAETDRRIWLIVGDVGFGATESFAQRFPGRFINAGVAEQNMMGVAAGLALSGKSVFVYSLANFPTLRCLEQIRNDICYHQANVKIIAGGAGLAYGSLGMTHHALEDLAVTRSLPGMTVMAPADPVETGCAIDAIGRVDGPCYLRLGRTQEPVIHTTPVEFCLGTALTVREGHDMTLISTGTILSNVVQVADRLNGAGIYPRVLSMHTISPIDAAAIMAAARETNAIVTVEEHTVVGGLGSAVAEVLAECDEAHVPFKRLGVPSYGSLHVGSQEYLRHAYGLSIEGILQSLKPTLDLIRN
jgi:transketolase